MFRDFGYSAVQEAVGQAYVIRGIPTYKISFLTAQVTLVFNALNRTWGEGGFWRVGQSQSEADLDWCHVSWLGKHIVGDRRILNPGVAGFRAGAIHEMTLDYQEHSVSDDLTTNGIISFPHRRVQRTAHIAAPDRRRLFFHDLELEFEAGLGDLTTTDPKVTIRYSDDGGHLWSDDIIISFGAQADYQQRLQTGPLGSSYDRVFEIVMSDPIPWRLLNAYVDVSVAKH